ncbi:MAG: LytTR family transcriptional regulator [Sphingomonadales bacterium]|nr:LytTR family transcriptional regulator [Sphingomonadales bacterium]
MATMLAIGLAMGLLGPFGTFAMPLGARLLNWVSFLFGGYLFFRPVIAAGELVARHTPLPRLPAIALACLLAAMPTTLLVAWLLLGRGVGRAGLGGLAELYGEVVIVGMFVTVIQLSTRARRQEPTSDEAQTATQVAQDHAASALPRLAARLPDDWGTRVIALSNEDHYVRVHVAEASTLLLMRLGDAIDALDGIDGARVHRGWWVARGAVRGVERRGRAVWLRLENGLEAPVARNAVAELRAQGWL